MGRQSRYEERTSRFPLPWLHGRSTDVEPTTAPRGHARVVRYGLRVLLVAGAAGAAWFLGSQAADAAPAHASAAPTHTAPRDAGILPAATRVVGSVTGTLTSSGGHAAAGDKTCGRPAAGPHGGTATPHTASVANFPRAAHQVAPGAVPAAGSTVVPAGGVGSDSTGALPARQSTGAANTSGVTAEAPGQSRGAPADAAPFGSTIDATRSMTRPLGIVIRQVAGPSQGLPTALPDALRPVTATVADVVGPVTGPLVRPLADATRPVTGLLTAAVHPLPGACDAVVTPLTGVLASVTGPLSGSVPPAGSTPIPASGQLAGTHQGRPVTGSVSTVQRWAGHPFATWTGHAGSRSAGSVVDTSVPTTPERAPLAYPGSGLSTGGTASSSGSHAGGAFTPAASTVVHAGTASRVRPATAMVGQPRLSEVDPVVTPD